MARPGSMTRPDTRQAEKDYLARTGSSEWERTKPFSPPSSDTLEESAHLLHDFSAAMLTLRPSPDDLILDLGAGAGWCSDLLGRLNRTSIAVDLSLDMLRAGRGRPGPPVRAVAGDMESLPLRTGTFDKAVCFSALHHVPDMSRAVREIARVLAPDGVALFSEPGEGHREAAVSTARAMKDFGVLEQEILIETFIRDCREAGFEDVRVKPLAYTIPGFDLTLDQWRSWIRLAESTRPRRALSKMGLALMEAFGLGKRGPLFLVRSRFRWCARCARSCGITRSSLRRSARCRRDRTRPSGAPTSRSSCPRLLPVLDRLWRWPPPSRTAARRAGTHRAGPASATSPSASSFSIATAGCSDATITGRSCRILSDRARRSL